MVQAFGTALGLCSVLVVALAEKLQCQFLHSRGLQQPPIAGCLEGAPLHGVARAHLSYCCPAVVQLLLLLGSALKECCLGLRSPLSTTAAPAKAFVRRLAH